MLHWGGSGPLKSCESINQRNSPRFFRRGQETLEYLDADPFVLFGIDDPLTQQALDLEGVGWGLTGRSFFCKKICLVIQSDLFGMVK